MNYLLNTNYSDHTILISPQFDGSERNLYYDIAMDIENSLEQFQPTNLSQMFTGQKMCKFLSIL